MTPLEALNDIIDELKWCCNDGKTLRKYDETRVKVIEKSLKVLEIIKRKNVDIGFMKYLIEMNYNVNNYNITFDEDDTDYMLTQEEFNLLKEVLK